MGSKMHDILRTAKKSWQHSLYLSLYVPLYLSLSATTGLQGLQEHIVLHVNKQL